MQLNGRDPRSFGYNEEAVIPSEELLVASLFKSDSYSLLKNTVLVFAAAVTVQVFSLTEVLVGQVSFNDAVRPILSNHCYACHGPDEEKREADLRLDVEGDVDWDELLERINSDDEDTVMPPPSHNKPLTAKKRTVLKSWIEDGAVYESHWAFELPTKVDVPAETHPVDYFIDRKLSANEWKRSPQAKPAILIRRLYLDLIGLPPTIEQAKRFIDDPTQTNYGSIVDELLQSPRYGERWARKWLDLARYADTNGYEKDRDRNIWPYRDWVIRAINDDMPFDQFSVEQLAGDMLPGATEAQLVATGFHRNTMLNEEGGIDPLEFRYHAMTDRVATTGATWLGLTTGCAQCHTHKFDPITHDDYFGMMAYLNNADEPELFLTSASVEKNREQADALLAELKSHWPKSTEEKKEPEFETAFNAWLEQQKANFVDWQTIVPESMSANMPHLTQEADGIIFAVGDTTKSDVYELNFPAMKQPVSAIRLQVLPDKRLPQGGPGLTYYEGKHGDFYLTEIEATSSDGKAIPWISASSTYAGNAFGGKGIGAEMSIDGDVQSGWSIAGRSGFRNVAVFNFKEKLPLGEAFTLTMKFGRHFASSLGKFRVSVAHAGKSLSATLLSKDVEDRDAEQTFLMQSKEVGKQADAIRKLLHPLQGRSTLVMRERSPEFSRKTFVHHRGEYTQPKHEAVPRLPDAIFDTENQSLPTNRLEFARWLVSRENPLAARVVANRQWAAFFGTGIVPTLDDFGMQGASPSHPELLDWLAVELMDQEWSIKKLHRLIVTSKSYQQSSNYDQPSTKAERLLQRFPRKRLEAEIIRDSGLAASGLLVDKMYGPPVRPPQPEGAAANYSQSKWKTSEGPDRFRRSVYTYQKRTAPFAMFTTFDASSGESCLARRDVSNTPLQALTLMNDPMFVEIAEALGKRMEAFEGSEEAKIVAGFRWLMTRQPTDSELESLSAFYQKHSGFTALARVLLCLDEAITKN